MYVLDIHSMREHIRRSVCITHVCFGSMQANRLYACEIMGSKCYCIDDKRQCITHIEFVSVDHEEEIKLRIQFFATT